MTELSVALYLIIGIALAIWIESDNPIQLMVMLFIWPIVVAFGLLWAVWKVVKK